jgi:hypothetical protein
MGGDPIRFENQPQPSGGSTTYAPAVPGDWSPAPATVGAGLDQIAARVTALEAGATAQQQIYSCPMGAAVRQLVYQSGDGAVDLADASDPAKMPAIGFIASKPTATTCVIQDEDELGGFVGLTPDVPYYADPATPGGITPTLPDVLAGEVVQQVCTPKTDAVIRIEISTPAPVEP